MAIPMGNNGDGLLAADNSPKHSKNQKGNTQNTRKNKKAHLTTERKQTILYTYRRYTYDIK